jgi:hypothetical protein
MNDVQGSANAQAANGSEDVVPLFRYWNGHNPVYDHLYTTDFSELGYGNYGWVLETIQCYVYDTQLPGTIPLHRYWNGRNPVYDHLYTTNWAELGYGKYGWSYEKVQCYLVFRGYAAESRWLSRTSGNRSQMAWSG